MDKQVLEFLKKLAQNNNRDWFKEHKAMFEQAKESALVDFQSIHDALQLTDFLEPMKMYRIYRDLRFTQDKTPYKNHFSMFMGRQKPNYRGGYYLHIEPGNSFAGLGFWGPNKEDLLRIRKEIEEDDELEKILNSKAIQNTFGTLYGDELKTAPKGFEKNHERIELLRKKQFLLTHSFTDEEVSHADFLKKAVTIFQQGRPFLDYMTDVLLTDLNGERLV